MSATPVNQAFQHLPGTAIECLSVSFSQKITYIKHYELPKVLTYKLHIISVHYVLLLAVIPTWYTGRNSEQGQARQSISGVDGVACKCSQCLRMSHVTYLRICKRLFSLSQAAPIWWQNSQRRLVEAAKRPNFLCSNSLRICHHLYHRSGLKVIRTCYWSKPWCSPEMFGEKWQYVNLVLCILARRWGIYVY